MTETPYSDRRRTCSTWTTTGTEYGTARSPDRVYNFGLPEIFLTRDWNHDGFTEIGGFRPSTHLFYLDYNGNGAWNRAVRAYRFRCHGNISSTGTGMPTVSPRSVGLRSSTHMFYLDYNGNGAWNGAVTDGSTTSVPPGTLAFTGDWNADGFTEIGGFRLSTHLFYLDINGNGVWNGPLVDKAYDFGRTDDAPVAGIWS